MPEQRMVLWTTRDGCGPLYRESGQFCGRLCEWLCGRLFRWLCELICELLCGRLCGRLCGLFRGLLCGRLCGLLRGLLCGRLRTAVPAVQGDANRLSRPCQPRSGRLAARPALPVPTATTVGRPSQLYTHTLPAERRRCSTPMRQTSEPADLVDSARWCKSDDEADLQDRKDGDVKCQSSSTADADTVSRQTVDGNRCTMSHG